MTTDTVTIGDAVLHLGDCREILSGLDPGCVAISDPPYGIGFVQRKRGPRRVGTFASGKPRMWTGDDRHAGIEIFGDDAPFDPAPLLGFCEILIWGADHYRARLPAGGRFLAWNKLGDKPSWDTFADVEFAWHSRPGASRIFSHLWKGICGWREHEARGNYNVRRDHPMQKPVALMRWCIEQTRGDGTIVDPYMGGGTTGVACAQLGRKFIGIEIERRWFDAACRRIEAAQQQKVDAA